MTNHNNSPLQNVTWCNLQTHIHNKHQHLFYSLINLNLSLRRTETKHCLSTQHRGSHCCIDYIVWSRLQTEGNPFEVRLCDVTVHRKGHARNIPRAPILFPSVMAVSAPKYIIQPSTTWRIKIYIFKTAHGHDRKVCRYTVMRRIATFRSTTDRIYDGGPIIL